MPLLHTSTPNHLESLKLVLDQVTQQTGTNFHLTYQLQWHKKCTGALEPRHCGNSSCVLSLNPRNSATLMASVPDQAPKGILLAKMFSHEQKKRKAGWPYQSSPLGTTKALTTTATHWISAVLATEDPNHVFINIDLRWSNCVVTIPMCTSRNQRYCIHPSQCPSNSPSDVFLHQSQSKRLKKPATSLNAQTSRQSH